MILIANKKTGLVVDEMGTNPDRGANDEVKLLRLLVCVARAKYPILLDEEYVTMQNIEIVELWDSVGGCSFLEKNM